MTQETIDLFEVDGIKYIHPKHSNHDGYLSVHIRPMIQLRTDDYAPFMTVNNNKPKLGLMDSEVDEKFLKENWYFE